MMMFAVTSWLALCAGAPFSAEQVAGSSSESGPAAVARALQAGWSEEFRERMLNWILPAPAAPLRLTNSSGRARMARLDRLAITSRFGWRSDPITGVERRHAGVDLPTRFGSPVMATAPGIVRIARWAGGYGNLVEIEHNGGVRTRYGHLSRLSVFPSEHVVQGQVIGEAGSTGHLTGPHLHYEVRIGGLAGDTFNFLFPPAPPRENGCGKELFANPQIGW